MSDTRVQNTPKAMLNIVNIGLSHKNSPVEIRERFAFTQGQVEMALRQLAEKPFVEECAILSTCNRVEIYAVTPDIERCVEDIEYFLAEFHGVPRDFLARYCTVHRNTDAVSHMLRVTASLDSMIVGEAQILGQVKQAYRTAQEQGTTKLILNRLFHYAFFMAKKVRYETEIGANAVSVSYAAVELARRIYDDLAERTVMLIGTGDMGELAAKHLIGSGVSEFIVASRSFDNARKLATELGGRPITMEEVLYQLKQTDIVITATGSNDYIIRQDHIHDALKLRNNEPMFLIDIAVPRDIDPRVGEIANVYLYDIDDLQGILDGNLQERLKQAERAEELVQHGIVRFSAWLDGLKVVPTIIAIKQRMEAIGDSELSKTLSRLSGLEDKDRKVVEALASGIVGKILHSPLTRLKKEASSSLGVFYCNTVQQLFDLDSPLELIEEEDTDNESSG